MVGKLIVIAIFTGFTWHKENKATHLKVRVGKNSLDKQHIFFESSFYYEILHSFVLKPSNFDH